MRQDRLPLWAIPDDIRGYYEAKDALWDSTRVDNPPGPVRIPAFNNPGLHRVYRTRSLIRYTRQYLSCMSVLEVGCGKGSSTRVLKDVFADVSAFDISDVNVEQTFKHSAVRAFQANVEYFTPERNYDLITMTEVLEHTRDPLAAAQRYLAKCTFMVASGPVAEELNPAGAFNLDRLRDVRAAGDTTGHIWSLDVEGFLDLFRGHTIIHSEVAGPSCIVLVRGKAPLPPVPSGRERILPWESV